MTKLVDPIKLLTQKLASNKAVASAPGLDPNARAAVPYELPLSPPAGAKLMRLTIASTYRTEIPVLFDPATRTTYPISSD